MFSLWIVVSYGYYSQILSKNQILVHSKSPKALDAHHDKLVKLKLYSFVSEKDFN